MTYTAIWTNSNQQGRLDAGEHFVALSDGTELAAAINRRRLLTYQSEQDYSSHLYCGAPVKEASLDSAQAPPCDNFRDALVEGILSAPVGAMGGSPATPAAMDWLWPVAGDDENKIIVTGGPGQGEVNLFGKLNSGDDWTDADVVAAQSDVRAVHFNELRQAIEWLRRGRWRLPLYFSVGIFSVLPDTPWIGEAVANDGSNELRSVGFAVIRTEDTSPLGLVGVSARAAGRLEITVDADCTVEVYRCLREIDFESDPPTWNEYDPGASASWDAPGGTGAGDAVLIGSIDLTAGQVGTLTGGTVADAFDAMINGAEQNFLVRRADSGAETVEIVSAEAVVEFDLDSPPN